MSEASLADVRRRRVQMSEASLGSCSLQMSEEEIKIIAPSSLGSGRRAWLVALALVNI